MNKKPIGVFDSGVGGLTVLTELARHLPHEDFIYLGDTARVPYGSKSPHVIQKYSLEVADYLLKNDIKYLVIACNTASAYAGDLLASKLPISVMGVIKPGVKALLSQTKNRRIGVIGTRATIKSGVYEASIAQERANVNVYSRACPLFVPLVEEGWVGKPITKMIIREYLTDLVEAGIDTLVLGCTHYPLLKKEIQNEFPGLTLIDSSVETACSVLKEIQESGIENDISHSGTVHIRLTDITEQIEGLERIFSDLTFHSVQEVELPEVRHGH